jgi:hypothetical protein
MTHLVIVTALMAEAVPLIDFYRMKKQVKQKYLHLFKTSSTGSLQIDLLVCGMGTKKMRQGLKAYRATLNSVDGIIWLNIGIAGTLSHPIGELVWANFIADVPIGLPDGIQNSPLISVRSLSEPSTDYRAETLFDMEAEAWFRWIAENTIQFAPERLFCAKVVSDNSGLYTHQIDKRWATDIVRKNINNLSNGIKNIIQSYR